MRNRSHVSPGRALMAVVLACFIGLSSTAFAGVEQNRAQRIDSVSTQETSPQWRRTGGFWEWGHQSRDFTGWRQSGGFWEWLKTLVEDSDS